MNSNQQNDDQTTHFGFSTINEDQKAEKVEGVFSSVASKYDLMNDVMSGGIHRIWKNTFMQMLSPTDGQHLLDVAGGTGDIAFRFLNSAGPSARATVCDMTQAMLDEGQKRPENREFESKLDWVQGDAMELPFPDQSFDRYTISFGLRNVTKIEKALEEAYRVLKFGGRILILEFSQLPNAQIQWLYDRYSFNVIPKMGEIIAQDRESYQYLVESIRRHPPQEKLAAMMRDFGFSRVDYTNLTFGVAAIHTGWKI